MPRNTPPKMIKTEIAEQIQTSWFNRRARENFEQFLTRPTPLRYLEIGTFAGASLFWVLEHIKPVWFTAIDPYPADKKRGPLETLAIGDEVLRLKEIYYPEQDGQLLRDPSEQVLPVLLAAGDYYDAAYIDGSHHGADVFFDAALASRLLTPGGWLIFDDFEAKSMKNIRCLRAAVDAFVRTHYDRFALIALRHGQVWLQKRDKPLATRRPGLGASLLTESEMWLGEVQFPAALGDL